MVSVFILAFGPLLITTHLNTFNEAMEHGSLLIIQIPRTLYVDREHTLEKIGQRELLPIGMFFKQ